MHQFEAVLKHCGVFWAHSAPQTAVAKDPTERGLRTNRISFSAEVKGAAVSLLPLCSNVVECLLNRTKGSFFLLVQLAGLGTQGLMVGQLKQAWSLKLQK